MARYGRTRATLVALVAVGVVGLAAVSVLTCVGGGVWPLAMLEHWRAHYLALAALAALVALAVGAATWADVGAAVALGNLVLVAPTCSAERLRGPADAAPVRLLLLNVHMAGDDIAAVRDLILRERPDVVALVEPDQRWLDGLAPALATVGPCLQVGRDDNFGMALCGRGEIDGAIRVLATGRPAIAATVHLAAASLHVVVGHPIPPIAPGLMAEQAVELAQLAGLARAAPAGVPTVMVGDFNATPWSRPFVGLLAATGLRDSRAGFGVGASFPSPLGMLGIPIDHVLVSPGVGVAGRRIGPAVGSDHRPVIIALEVPRRHGPAAVSRSTSGAPGAPGW